jgi:putative transposase
VNGTKKHIAVDTFGLLLAVLVTAAGVQDRDGARPLLWALHTCFPSIRLVWADSGYAGKLVGWATEQLRLTVQIVAKLTGQSTFVVLHRRWAVERTFSWINRCRRTVRDYERLPQHHAAMVQMVHDHHHDPPARLPPTHPKPPIYQGHSRTPTSGYASVPAGLGQRGKG